MPTRSPRSERRARAALGGLLCAAALAGSLAQAHEPGAQALPDTPGWQAGAALSAVLPKADEPWPVAAWPGVLVNGSAARDQRGGLRLEHATLDMAARLNRHLGAQWSLGWHDRDAAHIEAAQLQADMPWRDGHLVARLGRDTVRMGAVIDGAGHFDRFSQPPLAKRAVLNDQWIDDGLAVAWRRTEADGLRGIEAGLWRGRVFPGGAAGPAVPSMHLHAGWGHLDAHLTAAHFEPEGRGAAARSLGSTGHVHGALDCRSSLQQRVCVDGRVDVLGASLQWAPDGEVWSVAVAGLLRHERGSIYSTSGDALYRAHIQGVWADLAWRPAARWTLATRLERLVPSNRLEGTGTALLAREAGLDGGRAVERLGVATLFELRPDLQLALEAGHERSGAGRVSHMALRALWRNPRLLGRVW